LKHVTYQNIIVFIYQAGIPTPPPAAAVAVAAAAAVCRRDVDPEQAVALGAAIQAAVLLGFSSGVELMDGSYVEEFHNRNTGF
jgi:molecular chaperone DnaK (HSP70)